MYLCIAALRCHAMRCHARRGCPRRYTAARDVGALHPEAGLRTAVVLLVGYLALHLRWPKECAAR